MPNDQDYREQDGAMTDDAPAVAPDEPVDEKASENEVLTPPGGEGVATTIVSFTIDAELFEHLRTFLACPLDAQDLTLVLRALTVPDATIAACTEVTAASVANWRDGSKAPRAKAAARLDALRALLGLMLDHGSLQQPYASVRWLTMHRRVDRPETKRGFVMTTAVAQIREDRLEEAVAGFFDMWGLSERDPVDLKSIEGITVSDLVAQHPGAFGVRDDSRVA